MGEPEETTWAFSQAPTKTDEGEWENTNDKPMKNRKIIKRSLTDISDSSLLHSKMFQ